MAEEKTPQSPLANLLFPILGQLKQAAEQTTGETKELDIKYSDGYTPVAFDYYVQLYLKHETSQGWNDAKILAQEACAFAKECLRLKNE
jgi:hypothetical protein